MSCQMAPLTSMRITSTAPGFRRESLDPWLAKAAKAKGEEPTTVEAPRTAFAWYISGFADCSAWMPTSGVATFLFI